MADSTYISVRKEVQAYLHACEALLKEKNGSHDEFLRASDALLRKNGKLTNEELPLVQAMVFRLSVKLGQ